MVHSLKMCMDAVLFFFKLAFLIFHIYKRKSHFWQCMKQDLVSTMQKTGLANYASFLVWSEKKYHLWVSQLWGSQQPFFWCIWPFLAW